MTTTGTHPGEVSRLDVRVNPANGEFKTDDPDYIQGQIEDRDRLKQTFVERIGEGIEDGTFHMEAGPDGTIGESDILVTAHHMAQRGMTIRAALGGYGLVGKVDSLAFWGVELNWIADEDVAEGEFELEGVEDPAATMNYLTTIMP